MKIKILKSVGLYKKDQVVDMERKRGEQYVFASLGREYVAPVEQPAKESNPKLRAKSKE